MENTSRFLTPAAARVNAGLSQVEAARLLHISRCTLINWESGKTIPTTDKAQEMADLYDIPLQYFIFRKK